PPRREFSLSSLHAALPISYWEPIGGYEADTHKTGYAFFGPSYVHPVRPGFAWTARVFPNFLYYEFAEPSRTTKVRSPGVSTMLGDRKSTRLNSSHVSTSYA